MGDDRLRDALLAVVDGATVSLAGLAVDRLLVAATVAVLSAGVGPAGYGLFELGLRVQRLLLGVPRGFVRAVSRFAPDVDRPADRGVVVAVAAAGALLAAAALGGALAVRAPALAARTSQPAAFGPVLRAFGLALPAAVLVSLAGAVLRAHHRVRAFALLRFVAKPGSRLVAAVAVVAVAGGAVAVAWGAAVALVGVAGLGVAAVAVDRAWLGVGPSADADDGRARDSRALGRRVAGFGSRMSLSGVGNSFQFVGFFPVMAYFLSPAAAGFFGAAFVLSSLVRWPLVGINQLVPPVAADLYAVGDDRDLRRLHAVSSRLVLAVAAPVAVAVVVHRGAILGALDPSYRAFAALLPLFVLARLAEAGVGSVGILLATTDNDDVHLRLNAVLTVLTLVAVVGLTARHGLAGTAVAFLLVRAGNNLAQLAALARLEGFQPFGRAHLRPVAAACLAVPALAAPTLVADGIVAAGAGVVLGAAVYGAALRRLGLPRLDREVLAAVAGRGGRAGGAAPAD
jgi:O-antigen/teichoic acid export membrane protein